MSGGCAQARKRYQVPGMQSKTPATLRRHGLASALTRPSKEGLGRVPLAHPRPCLRDQHAVVHGYSTPCVCAQYGAYAVEVGIEPTNAALALPDRHFPAGGSYSPLVYVDYLLVLVQQCRQPIRFLYACVKLSVLPSKIISLPLYSRDAYCANELHLRACCATLRC